MKHSSRHPPKTGPRSLFSSFAAVATTIFLLSGSCQQQQRPIQTATDPAPQAATSIDFGPSLDEAFVAAKRDGRRVLVYFSGDHCGWCRRMEQETHVDPEVMKQAGKFVCVKISTSEYPDLAEKYCVYSIPRTLVLTAEGQPVVERVGYQPADEHRQWLENALEPLSTTWPEHYQRMAEEGAKTSQPNAPPPPGPCGAPVDEADLVIWFIEQDTNSFQDGGWVAHSDLLAYLGSKGFRPRIEHLYRWHATDRFNDVAAERRLPDILVSKNHAGLLRDLMRQEMISDAISTRLSQPDATAICHDFADRSIWTVDHAPHAERATDAVEWLFAPRDDVRPVPGPKMTVDRRQAAVQLAERVARAWQAGDAESVKAHWHSKSPQRLASSTSPELAYRDVYEVTTAGVRLYGNDQLAMAVVETRASGSPRDRPPFISHFQRIGAPSLVILAPEKGEWCVLALGLLQYDFSIAEVAALLNVVAAESRSGSGGDPPTASIVFPPDGFEFGDEASALEWKMPADHGNVQFWYVQTVDDRGWPSVWLRKLSGETPDSEPLSIRGSTTAEIWSIAPEGRIGFSEPVHWTYRSSQPAG